MEALRDAVFQALGEASMCWSETPKGVFDSEQAVKIGDALLMVIQQYIEDSNRDWTGEELDYLVTRWNAIVAERGGTAPSMITAPEVMAQLRKMGLLEESKA